MRGIWPGYDFRGVGRAIAAGFIENSRCPAGALLDRERDGEIVGSVLLVRDSEEIGQLRLLLGRAKGSRLGIGRLARRGVYRLARRAGYRKLTLWTNDVLVSARRIYESVGFT